MGGGRDRVGGGGCHVLGTMKEEIRRERIG